MLLSKGFEVEMYTGTPEGVSVGFSDRIAAALPGFAREPDNRNVEYITDPIFSYDRLPCTLLAPRAQLRQFLRRQGNYTLLPGSTLALGGSDRFHRSDPDNPYHSYIEKTYGTDVVTASVHINLGIDDPERLIQATRLLRAEAALYLAISAASPFLDGQVTGFHSSRWSMFPRTPARVPLFLNQQHYIDWTYEQLAAGTMQNVRHLWLSVRPNGPQRPEQLNRVEVRISEMVGDPISLLAMTALMEARLLQMLRDPERFDPLNGAFAPSEMAEICDRNEAAAAKDSLDARLIHWKTGQEIVAAEWIEQQYAEAWLTVHPLGFSCFLSPLQKILREGNETQRWLRQVNAGRSVQQVYRDAIQDLEQREIELMEAICTPAMGRATGMDLLPT
ncbi:glutamate--cysteine ligase [Synechococcus sp. PCC 7336]|uniref:glutamate--cysteine ligase n=1 Tax=Synechococcus sp. PCC 7336 TaxID=195250 RepID=UPI0003452909|nr:glutamate--cysteine ligase [Synechococcus sp. PCC 7336]